MKITSSTVLLAVFFTAGCTKVIRNPDREESPQEVSSTQSHPEVAAAGEAMPRAEAPAQPQLKEIVGQISNQLHFDSNSAELKPEAVSKLRELAAAVKQDPAAIIKLEGHTDSVGSKKLNAPLSLKRAKQVASVLKENGVPAKQLEVNGLAASKPIADNSTESGRYENRRVDVVVASG